MARAPSDERSVDLRRVVNVVGLLLLVLVVGLFVVASVPQLVGADKSYVVQSDSMSPAIDAGAIVFVSEIPTDEIARSDVITFERAGETSTTTHRVVDVQRSDGSMQFVTKGDANEDPDPEAVPASAVVGKVAFHVPLIGYVVSFASTQLGLLTLIVVPALLLVILELRDFWRAMREEDGEDVP